MKNRTSNFNVSEARIVNTSRASSRRASRQGERVDAPCTSRTNIPDGASCKNRASVPFDTNRNNVIVVNKLSHVNLTNL